MKGDRKREDKRQGQDKDDKRREEKEGKNKVKSKVERKCFRCGLYGHIQKQCMSHVSGLQERRVSEARDGEPSLREIEGFCNRMEISVDEHMEEELLLDRIPSPFLAASQ